MNELETLGLPPPSIIQLELSPFNQHKDVVQWATDHGSTMSCAAWSKLSSVDGPQDGWAVLAKIAKEKGVTKVNKSKEKQEGFKSYNKEKRATFFSPSHAVFLHISI